MVEKFPAILRKVCFQLFSRLWVSFFSFSTRENMKWNSLVSLVHVLNAFLFAEAKRNSFLYLFCVRMKTSCRHFIYCSMMTTTTRMTMMVGSVIRCILPVYELDCSWKTNIRVHVTRKELATKLTLFFCLFFFVHFSSSFRYNDDVFKLTIFHIIFHFPLLDVSVFFIFNSMNPFSLGRIFLQTTTKDRFENNKQNV